MPSSFPWSPVIRECPWRKPEIEKKKHDKVETSFLYFKSTLSLKEPTKYNWNAGSSEAHKKSGPCMFKLLL